MSLPEFGGDYNELFSYGVLYDSQFSSSILNFWGKNLFVAEVT